MNPLLAVSLPLLVAYGVTFGWIWEMWNFREAYYAHGPLVLLVAIGVVYTRRRALAQLPGRIDPRGWLLLVPALLAHLVGAALMIDSLSAVSLGFAIPGAVWLGTGPARTRALLPVLVLLFFAIPTPLVVQSRMAFELKEVAVEGGLWLANLVGTGAARTGASIAIPGQTQELVVADACSGLRSLVALVTLGYCFAFFLGAPTIGRRVALLLAAAPLAVLTNALRIAAICVLARQFGTPFASGTGHDVVSVLVWVVDLGGLLGIDALVSRRRTNR